MSAMMPPPGGYGVPPYSPYQQPPMAVPTKPAVWTWYVVYAGAMAVMYVLVFGLGLLLAFTSTREEQTVQGVIMAGVSLPLMVLFGVAPFLKKSAGTWVFHLILICLGLTSACCMPASIPLLIFWLKPETKQFFGRI